MQVELKYQIGEKIKAGDRIYTVIGFEYVIERGLRYILLHANDGKVLWEYLFSYEIEAMTS